jgi:hypothetical protein
VAPFSEPLPARGHRGGSGASRGGPIGSKLPICALPPDPSRSKAVQLPAALPKCVLISGSSCHRLGGESADWRQPPRVSALPWSRGPSHARFPSWHAINIPTVAGSRLRGALTRGIAFRDKALRFYESFTCADDMGSRDSAGNLPKKCSLGPSVASWAAGGGNLLVSSRPARAPAGPRFAPGVRGGRSPLGGASGAGNRGLSDQERAVERKPSVSLVPGGNRRSSRTVNTSRDALLLYART